MARISGRLTTLAVARAHKPGLLADGDGLYLQVGRANSRSWVFRYARNGKTREMGLGPLKAISLAAARARVTECRAQLADGRDSLAPRAAEQARRAVEDARGITFDECAAAFIRFAIAGVAQW